MSNTTSASVHRAPKTPFECALCIIDKDESCMMIDFSPVCLECVQTMIPTFELAAQYEVDYPVEWSANLTLNPQDFAEFFDDFPSFLSKWTEREQEYLTSAKERLYCQGCAGFVGNRTAFLNKIALCNGCKLWVCSWCGSKKRDSPHECRVDAKEKLEGYRKCPGCDTLIVLEDGCNDMVCAVCRTRHCYCCGEIDPKPDHWSRKRGSSCARFNPAGAENALFNEDVGEDMGEQDDERVDMDEEVVQEMLRWTHRTETEVAVLTAMRPNSVGPATDPTIPARQREIMNNHRNMMQSVVDSRVGVRDRLQREGLLERNPNFAEKLHEIASKLVINVDLYIWFVRIREAHADYRRRHEDVMNFLTHGMHVELFSFWPALSAAFAVYMHVAPARLAAAAPRSDN